MKLKKTFVKMVDKFPSCAMAHWGYALTLLTPRWSNKIKHNSLIKGSVELELATTLSPNNHREQKLLSSFRVMTN